MQIVTHKKKMKQTPLDTNLPASTSLFIFSLHLKKTKKKSDLLVLDCE